MTKRDRIVLGVLALAGVLAAFYLVVAKPKAADLGELNDNVAAAEQRRDVALADLQTASAAREQYKRDTQTLAVLGKAVPADDGVPSLLYQLHKAARKAGVDFDAVTVGEGATGTTTPDATPGLKAGPEGLSILPLKITFDGDFFKLDRFLREVRGFATIGDEKVDVRGRLLTVDGVTLAPGESGLPTLRAEINASAYVSTAEADAATGTAAGGAQASASATAAGATPSSGTAGAASSGTADGTGAAAATPSTASTGTDQ